MSTTEKVQATDKKPACREVITLTPATQLLLAFLRPVDLPNIIDDLRLLFKMVALESMNEISDREKEALYTLDQITDYIDTISREATV